MSRRKVKTLSVQEIDAEMRKARDARAEKVANMARDEAEYLAAFHLGAAIKFVEELQAAGRLQKGDIAEQITRRVKNIIRDQWKEHLTTDDVVEVLARVVEVVDDAVLVDIPNHGKVMMDRSDIKLSKEWL